MTVGRPPHRITLYLLLVSYALKTIYGRMQNIQTFWLRPGFQSLTSAVAFFMRACWTIFISDGQMASFTARALPTCPYNSFEKQLGEQGDLALPCSFPLRRIVQVQELAESRKNNIPLQYTVKWGRQLHTQFIRCQRTLSLKLQTIIPME